MKLRAIKYKMFCFGWLLVLEMLAMAQLPSLSCTFKLKNNIMYLTVPQNIADAGLDSFTSQYNLGNIGLYQLVKTHTSDSLKKNGWKVDASNEQFYVISKTIESPGDIIEPGNNVFTPVPTNWRMVGGNKVVYGINRFQKGAAFQQQGRVVYFFLKGYASAKRVRLAGSFSNWQFGAFPMKKTANGWKVAVKLSDGPHYYKFIINDDDWITDPANQQIENDGMGNENSVFYLTNKSISLNGYPNARYVYLSGSFNNWEKDQLPLYKTAQGWQIDIYLEKGTHQYQFIVDGKPVTSKQESSNTTKSSLALGKAHVFTLKGFENARKVVLAGNFNDWNPSQLYMERTPQGWQLPYALGPGNYQYKFIVDGNWITDPANPGIVNDGDGNQNSFLVIGANYEFSLNGYANARQVFVAGDFNDWADNVSAMKKINGVWQTKLYLGKGKHRYKFIVDGKWILDPANSMWEDNEFGTGNSVIWKE